jgi:hypothetical protein
MEKILNLMKVTHKKSTRYLYRQRKHGSSQRCSSVKVITGGDGTTRIMSDDGNAVKYEGRSNMKAHKML